MHLNRRLRALLAFSLSGLVACAHSGVTRPASCDDEPARFELAADKHELTAGKVRVTYLGTSTLLIEDQSTQILIDGFVTRLPFIPVAVAQISSDTDRVKAIVEYHHMENLRAVFVTHSHYDHAFDVAAIIKAIETRRRELNLEPRPVLLYGSESTRMIGLKGNSNCEPLGGLQPATDAEIPLGYFSVTALVSEHIPVGWPIARPGNITKPLCQPARERDYREGGVYDFLVKYCDQDCRERGGKKRSLLVRSSASLPSRTRAKNPLPHPDFLFLSVGRLAKQDSQFQKDFLKQTIELEPGYVIATHWDNFFKRLDEPLTPASGLMDNALQSLRFLDACLCEKEKKIPFGIMQGRSSVILFDHEAPRRVCPTTTNCLENPKCSSPRSF